MKVISMKGLVEKAHGKICQDSDSSVAYRKKDGAVVVPGVPFYHLPNPESPNNIKIFVLKNL